MKKAIVIIPARYDSTRLPGKVLLKQTGKYLVQHTYEQVCKAKLIDRVMVATDDRRVYRAVKSFGGAVVMTSSKHRSGTDRVAEIARKLNYDFIINVQADEPEIDPSAIDLVVNLLSRSQKTDMVTLACPFKNRAEFCDPNKVKVWLNRQNFAVDFSRNGCRRPAQPLRHIGIYGYRRKSLLKFVRLDPIEREKSEKLEQLRALENGFLIKVGLIKKAPAGIDTLKDYQAFVKRMEKT
ncbi:MAG: 3-deoxy-manno-octulosonate cytidylyltransferase [Planctomycetota bacterium]